MSLVGGNTCQSTRWRKWKTASSRRLYQTRLVQIQQIQTLDHISWRWRRQGGFSQITLARCAPLRADAIEALEQIVMHGDTRRDLRAAYFLADLTGAGHRPRWRSHRQHARIAAISSAAAISTSKEPDGASYFLGNS